MEYDMGFDLVLSAGGIRVLDRQKARTLRALKESGGLGEVAKKLRTTEKLLRKRIDRLMDENGKPFVSIKGGRASLTKDGIKALDVYESRSKFISELISHRYRNPLLTVDGIVIHDDGLVVVRRARLPCKGRMALPGGIVEYGETVEEAVVREVREETGLETVPERLVSIRSKADRDPRGHFVSIVFLLRVVGGRMRSGDDADAVALVPLDPLPDLAFDHTEIVRDFLAGEGLGECPVHSNR
jgi:8-oxo-dGTP diphosphatase